MLSKAKASYLAAAAALVILSGVTVSSTIASAQSRQPAQVEKQDAQDNRKSESRREQRRETSQNRDTRSRTVVRSDRDRRPDFIRDRDRRRVIIRSRPSSSVGFVVLGPRVVYRAYGPGWCRGLHSGRHWARRIGWHAGRHYGPFRC